VFLNILRNGAQAMQTKWSDKNGKIDGKKKPSFTLRLIHEKDAKMLRIEIEDNGPGMDKTTRKRVFEPFFTTKPIGEGTGLGLSVSYFTITENHGGTVDVNSTPGQGANFIIRLPLIRSEA
jgi:signal transduction histidine kinase